MTIRVRLAAHIVGSEIIVVDDIANEFASLVTSLESAPEDGPEWLLPLKVGKGVTAKDISIELRPFLSNEDYKGSYRAPIFIEGKDVSGISRLAILFKNRFFMPERSPKGSDEKEEVGLRVKRAVYREDEELNSLRAYVSNIEAAIEYRGGGVRRTAIPEDVKLAVWTRDVGACVRCGSTEKLHFDHINPVAKGGGNDLANIQILCSPCNLRKSDKIAT
jgi:hypothetical protein